MSDTAQALPAPASAPAPAPALLKRVRGSISLLHLLLFVTVVVLLTCCFMLFSYYLSIRLVVVRSDRKLLWLTPRSGGFNNQLLTVYQAINCAKLHNRTVVLPFMYENVRYDTSFRGSGPFPFEHYFDVSSLRQIASVTTPAELQRSGVPCDAVYISDSAHSDADRRHTPRLLSEHYARRLFRGLNITYVRSFSRPVEHACVDDSMCRGEDFAALGAYSAYDKWGQGYDIRHSRVFREIRSALKPSATVEAISKLVLEQLPPAFNAVHLRRGDYEDKCAQLSAQCKRFGSESMVQGAQTVVQRVRQLDDWTLPLFVSTTHVDQCRQMLNGSGIEPLFLADFALPPRLRWAAERVDVLSFAERVVASEARQFIGNRFSSFSAEINYMRYLRNSSDQLRFF